MSESGTIAIRAGLALAGWELRVERDACIWIRGGIIESIEGTATCPPNALGWSDAVVLPQPANAHIHSGDFAFPEYATDLDLLDAVAPPDGLKHRLLERTPPEQLIEAIRTVYTQAWRTGTGLLVDFREGGGVGCLLARQALSGIPSGMDVLVLGRPGPRWPEGCDGLGLSSPLDYPVGTLRSLARASRPAMAHVAEHPKARESGDLERAIEAGFDAIVHGVYLNPDDLEVLAEKRVPLVACVRSNAWHGLGLPRIAQAWRAGVKLALGTDNAGWFPPDPWREAEALALVARLQGLKNEAANLALEALFVNGYTAARRRPRFIEEGLEAHVVVVDGGQSGIIKALNARWAVLKRVTGDRILLRVDGSRVTRLGLLS